MATYTDVTTKLNTYLQTPQHRSYFIIFVTLIFIIVMVIFGILPAYTAFTIQGAENEKRQEAITRLDSKLTTLKKLTGESQNKADIIKYFETIFPALPDQETILNELITIGNETSVYLAGLGFKENKELKNEFSRLDIPLSSNVRSLTLEVTMEGSQQTLNNFINNIEEKRRIYNIKSLNIIRKSDQQLIRTSPDKYYTLVMSVNIYYFNDSQTQPVL